MDAPDPGRPTGLSTDVVADAVDVLNGLVGWELAPARWEQVERLVELIQLAAETADRDAFAAAVADLELLGPIRITRIGATPTVSVPTRIRERANKLVHDLSPAPTPRSEPDDRAPRL